MENIIEHPFFTFYFDDSSPIRAIDVNESDYESALHILYFILTPSFLSKFKILRYEFFQNIY